MNHDVFLSYSQQDQSIAEEVCRHLEAGGVHCWMAPRDIGAGEEWGRAILEAIRTGQRLRLKGKGVSQLDGSSIGNHFVTILVKE